MTGSAAEADRRQADYFCNELRRQIGLLDEESQKIRTTLADAERRGDRPHVHAVSMTFERPRSSTRKCVT